MQIWHQISFYFTVCMYYRTPYDLAKASLFQRHSQFVIVDYFILFKFFRIIETHCCDSHRSRQSLIFTITSVFLPSWKEQESWRHQLNTQRKWKKMAVQKVNEWTASFAENVGIRELKGHHPKLKGLWSMIKECLDPSIRKWKMHLQWRI